MRFKCVLWIWKTERSANLNRGCRGVWNLKSESSPSPRTDSQSSSQPFTIIWPLILIYPWNNCRIRWLASRVGCFRFFAVTVIYTEVWILGRSTGWRHIYLHESNFPFRLTTSSMISPNYLSPVIYLSAHLQPIRNTLSCQTSQCLLGENSTYRGCRFVVVRFQSYRDMTSHQ